MTLPTLMPDLLTEITDAAKAYYAQARGRLPLPAAATARSAIVFC